MKIRLEKGTELEVEIGDTINYLNGDTVRQYFPITKVDEEKRMVYGWASTETPDKQEEIVSREAIEDALPDYLKWRNIREMHTKKAVGTAPVVEMRENGLWVEAEVIDDQAWKFVKSGVYKGFSIGGKRLKSENRFSKAMNKSLPCVTKMLLTEISLVDHPANPDCAFSLAKMDDGTIIRSSRMDMKKFLADLMSVVKGASVDLGVNDLSEVYGEEFAASFAKSTESLPEETRDELIKQLLSDDVVKSAKEKMKVKNTLSETPGDIKDEYETDADGKPILDENGKPKKKKSAANDPKNDKLKPEAMKATIDELTETVGELKDRLAKAEEVVKSVGNLEAHVTEMDGVFKTLADENGLVKTMGNGLETIEKAEGILNKFAEYQETTNKMVTELRKEVDYLKTLRGVRRSGVSDNAEGSGNDWGSQLGAAA